MFKLHSEYKPTGDQPQAIEYLSNGIKEIREYNGITTILIEGLESNDINHRGEFDFSVDKDTELLWKEAKIELSSLKEGQNVSITSTGEILESYPAQLTKVTKIIVLEDEL